MHLRSPIRYAHNSGMTQPSTITTARRKFHLRREVHAAVAGAENALCGVRLLGAVPIDNDPTDAAPVSCSRCAAHRFETDPTIWPLVQPVGPDVTEVGGLPETTGGW